MMLVKSLARVLALVRLLAVPKHMMRVSGPLGMPAPPRRTAACRPGPGGQKQMACNKISVSSSEYSSVNRGVYKHVDMVLLVLLPSREPGTPRIWQCYSCWLCPCRRMPHACQWLGP
jgi:hypothetical protein